MHVQDRDKLPPDTCMSYELRWCRHTYNKCIDMTIDVNCEYNNVIESIEMLIAQYPESDYRMMAD